MNQGPVMKKNVLRNEKGFTLIEIIAVLIILGILAAVAVPKFTDLQSEAREKAIQGALAAGASQLTMEYSRALLNGGATGSSWAYSSGNITLGDFNATLSANCSASGAVVTIVAGPSWVADVTNKTKSFTICD